MRVFVLALLLAAILGLLSQRLQGRFRVWLQAAPSRVFAVPLVLSAIFCAVAAYFDVLTAPLATLVVAYTLAPAVAEFVQGAGSPRQPSWLDFGVLLSFWLPLEFAAGQQLLPRSEQGFFHSFAYGIAIILALALFLGFRSFSGLKYNLPSIRLDFRYALLGFLITAPVLIVVGIAIGFIPFPHLPRGASAWWLISRFAAILVATALPEEILFRSLIQNFLMQRFGSSLRILLLASLIFGLAHLDNGPQPAPNWRYGILATIAGLGYGKVFEKSSSLFGSVLFHAMVDWTKFFFF